MNTNPDILLVEDSQNDIDLALYALQEDRLANSIFVVRDGKEALDFLFCRGAFTERSFNHPPKLVLLDLKLPKVDGLQALKQLKNDSRTKTIPVVIMTSSGEERDLIEGYNLGVNSYIQKPVDFDQFRATVKTLGLYWLVVNRPPVPIALDRDSEFPLTISAREIVTRRIREIGKGKRPEETPEEALASSRAELKELAETHLAQMEEGRRLAEYALREGEERYRLLLDGIPDYAIFMMDAQGRILSWNAGAERIKGYSADQIIGRSFSCFFPQEDIERGTPEEILRITAAKGRHEEQGMRVRKDGSQFMASLAFTALRDRAGNLQGFSEFSHDLSERRESEARYRGLLEAAPDAMVVVNSSGEIVLLNVRAEKEFGYSRDELVGQEVKNIIPEGFAERIIADGTRSAAEALAQQIGTGIELLGKRKDGTKFPIEIMLSPLESAEGILVTAAIRDISGRKNSAEHLVKTVGELKRSNDELQQFAYVASHDLQEPLRMVASYTQLLGKRYKGRLDSDADEFIAFAVDGCNRMQGLIEDLLAYSRAGTNGQVLCEVSSEQALKRALTNLKTSIEQSGAVVTHDSLPSIRMDETQLSQVFQNLIGNAIKYRGAEAPQVHVSASRTARNEWMFSVKDNGLGIDPQYFERIFVLFQRLHGRNEFEGTGIGLAICKKVLERVGGRIWVESELKLGSTFYFALPEGA